jgi:hypothetical protein
MANAGIKVLSQVANTELTSGQDDADFVVHVMATAAHGPSGGMSPTD